MTDLSLEPIREELRERVEISRIAYLAHWKMYRDAKDAGLPDTRVQVLRSAMEGFEADWLKAAKELANLEGSN